MGTGDHRRRSRVARRVSLFADPPESLTVRSTQTYRREEGGWKIVHRHVDNPPRDPSSPPHEVAEDSDD